MLGSPKAVPPSNSHRPAWKGRPRNSACKLQINQGPGRTDVCNLGGGSGPSRVHAGVLRTYGSRRTTTQRVTKDGNAQCNNTTKECALARTGRRIQRKHMTRDMARRSLTKM